MKARIVIGALTLSASALVGIAVHEGYRGEAYIPVKGDKPTLGYGTTDGVKPGDRIEPVQALVRKLADVQRFEGALKQCVRVPLHQHEYDAFMSLAYNIGTSAFCGSTLVRRLNAGDYTGACNEILRWDRFRGEPLRGLTLRRQAENRQCLGQ
jgi:lysozyme